MNWVYVQIKPSNNVIQSEAKDLFLPRRFLVSLGMTLFLIQRFLIRLRRDFVYSLFRISSENMLSCD